MNRYILNRLYDPNKKYTTVQNYKVSKIIFFFFFYIFECLILTKAAFIW